MIKHQGVLGSSNVYSFGYDPRNRILEVRFHDGQLYQYFDVDENIFREMQSAPSTGRFIGTVLRGKFPYRRVREIAEVQKNEQ